MDIEIISKKENPLLKRTEVRFRAIHMGAATPKRDDVREKLAATLNANKGVVVVDNMVSRFGRGETLGWAKIYKSQEAIPVVERSYLLKRNKLDSLSVKKGGKKSAKKEA